MQRKSRFRILVYIHIINKVTICILYYFTFCNFKCYHILMKEIIKYLRQLNSFTQEETAEKLGITRQSYIKYENGKVLPSEKMVEKMAALYNVTPEYIHENKIPEPGKTGTTHSIKESEPIAVADSMPSYSSLNGKNTYDAWFDGNTVRVKDPSFKFTKGQQFKIVVEDEEEAVKRKQEAWENIQRLIKEKVKPFHFDDDDPYYKKAFLEALDERYGLTD